MKKNGTDTFGFARKRTNQTKSRTCMKYWKHLYFVFAKAFWSLTKDATVLYTEWQREFMLHSFLHWACQIQPSHFISTHIFTEIKQDWSRLQPKYHFPYHRHLIPLDQSETIYWSMLSSTDTVIQKMFNWCQIRIISNFITNGTIQAVYLD